MILSPPSARSREPNRCCDDSRACRGPATCSEPGQPVPSLSRAQSALPVSSIVERSAVLSLSLALSVALSLSKRSVEVKDQVEGSRGPVAGPRRRQPAAPSRLPCVGHDIDLAKKVASLQYRLGRDLGTTPHSTPQTDPIQGPRSRKGFLVAILPHLPAEHRPNNIAQYRHPRLRTAHWGRGHSNSRCTS
jgi:hypothetical protein